MAPITINFSLASMGKAGVLAKAKPLRYIFFSFVLAALVLQIAAVAVTIAGTIVIPSVLTSSDFLRLLMYQPGTQWFFVALQFLTTLLLVAVGITLCIALLAPATVFRGNKAPAYVISGFIISVCLGLSLCIMCYFISRMDQVNNTLSTQAGCTSSNCGQLISGFALLLSGGVIQMVANLVLCIIVGILIFF